MSRIGASTSVILFIVSAQICCSYGINQRLNDGRKITSSAHTTSFTLQTRILLGHFGDPLALPNGNCEACSCYPPGTEQTDKGVSICEQLSGKIIFPLFNNQKLNLLTNTHRTGNCRCKPNVIGRNCNECQNGFFNIVSGNGCESCNCDPIGSFNTSCERFTGQCYCKPGVTGYDCQPPSFILT